MLFDWAQNSFRLLACFLQIKNKTKTEAERVCQCIDLNNTDKDHGLDAAHSASTASQPQPRNAHRPLTSGRS